MGTNYYLIKKKNLTPKDIDKDKVQVLDNGYVFENHYYKELDELKDLDIAKKIHIGKSSYGWNFLLCIYKDLDINDWEDYLKLLKNNDDYIVINEYGTEISIYGITKIVTKRKGELLENHEIYKTVESVLSKEYGDGTKVNKFGLITHGSQYSIVQPNMDKTYDLTTDTNFI